VPLDLRKYGIGIQRIVHKGEFNLDQFESLLRGPLQKEGLTLCSIMKGEDEVLIKINLHTEKYRV